jgi:choline dehydrogenase-like flavoprotein
MIADLETAGREDLDRLYDVCVVGSGPAGMTVARRLAARGFTVALMEGGGLEIDGRSQDLYAGENLGLDYFTLDTTRLRYFGGSSNHWGGMSRALDEHDFEPKPRNAWSGWPITKRALDPYRSETDAILDLKPAAASPDLPLEDPLYRFRRISVRVSSPATRFAGKYRDEIERSDELQLVVNANLVDIRLTEDLGNVDTMVFRSYAPGDPGLRLRARRYVLCLGGIENPRALLNANGQLSNGIGNGHDLVGRFFSEHPHYVVADVLFERPELRPTRRWDFYSPTRAFLAEHQCLNFNIRLTPDVIRTDPVSPVKEVIRGAACAVPFSERLAERVLGRSLSCEKGGFATAFGGDDTGDGTGGEDTGTLQITSEQALNPESRVRLADDRDALGLRRIALDWQVTDLDYETMRIAAVGAGEVLAEQGLARVRLRDWLLADAPRLPGFESDEVGGHHHMCTTRMSRDPRRGVVDGNCRVHGIGNLHLGGSSTFATGGWANPTYTIVQLALRLGDHLADELTAS